MMLNLHSYYSLRYGTLSIAQLVEGLQQQGYDTAVLTDINNSSAVLEFVVGCKTVGLNGLAGMEFREGDRLLFIGIAQNTEGFRELNELMTDSNRYKKPLPERAPEFKHVQVVYPYPGPDRLRDYEYIGIRPDQLNRIRFERHERCVMLCPVSFRADDYTVHRHLRAIDRNILISQLDDSQTARRDEVFISRTALLEIYRDFPILIANTEKLLASCSFDFDFNSHKNKKTFTGNIYDDRQLLTKYAYDGLKRRYGLKNKEARRRVESEIEVIDRLGFSGYFLITDDICRYARSRQFHYVGRGSGANSIVAYCLGITNVCPIELNLYFERFLNPKRQNPPDFDVDFSWQDRDEIYDYIFKRYQGKNTALMGAMSTFKDRSIIRELGKVQGLPKAEIDRLIKEPENPLNRNEVVQAVLGMYERLADFPNQRTIHASGVLIAEEPLTYYSALDYPPKNLPTVQYDMYVAEDIGFEKFDILSQRGIGHIKDCREVIRLNRDAVVDTSDPQSFFKDTKMAARLKEGDTVGCFYIESPAMRQLLRKLRCDNYLTLVAASSIIRPGVSSSGMMQAYIERHLNPEKVSYIHPAFKEQLEDTYGVMVYQEDVMKIGHHFGGLDLADADVLRRMMSGKYRSKNHLMEIEDKYWANCRAKGYPDEVSAEVWRQMESFAGYSFNKAHSASFAVESYQSLYLKTYFPLEFMVAVLNNYGGYYSREVYVSEAKRAGAKICLPAINQSEFNTSIQGDRIFLGFDGVLGLESSLARLIPEERKHNGPYQGLEDFLVRTGAGLEQAVLLIRCGALGLERKKEMLWQAHLLLNKNNAPRLNPLFPQAADPQLPQLDTNPLEHIFDEMELLGFPVSGTWFDLAKSEYRGDITFKTLADFQGKVVRLVGWLATWKTVRTKNKKIMKFGTFIDVNGDFVETVHFPQTLQSYPLRGKGLYLVEGCCVVEHDFPVIEVFRCALMPLKPDPRSV